MDKRVLLLVLLISLPSPVFPRRSSSGGGGNFNRGSSGARGNPPPSGGFGGGQPGGFQPGGQQGGFRPPPQNNNFNNGPHPPPARPNNIGGSVGGGARPANTQPGFGGGGFGGRPMGGPQSFQPSGVGSRASSGGFKTALAAGALGAVGGVLAWEAGKAIIRSTSEPFNHGGRNYYWDNNYKQQNGMITCQMPLSELQGITAASTTTTTTTTTTTVSPSETTTVDPNAATTTTVAPTPDNVLNAIQYQDGTRPKTVSWGCKGGSEVCCGTDCCPAPAPPIQQSGRPSATSVSGSIATVATLIIIFLLLLCCCGCFIVYKCFGGSFGGDKRNEYDQGQGEYPMQQYGQQPNYSQPQYDQHNQGGYPPQNQYPNQGYPPQPQYPNQYNPNQYPAYPQHQQY